MDEGVREVAGAGELERGPWAALGRRSPPVIPFLPRGTVHATPES